MENFTEANKTYTFLPNVWHSNLSVLAICILFTLYILVALMYYRIFVQKKHKGSFWNLLAERRNAILSRYICMAMSVAAIVTHVSSFGMQWLLHLAVEFGRSLAQRDSTRIACEVVGKLEITATTVAIGMGYLFLWLRQRIFYVHPSLKFLDAKCIKFISAAIIIAWILFFVVGLVCFYVLVRFEFNLQSGCLVENDTVEAYDGLILFWVVLSIVTQLTLLILFVYPLVKRSSWLKNSLTARANLHKRVKKAIAITAITLASDVISGIIAVSFSANYQNTFVVIYNLNIVINLLGVIFCFDHWQVLLWPWKSSENRSTASVTFSKKDDSFLSNAQNSASTKRSSLPKLIVNNC